MRRPALILSMYLAWCPLAATVAGWSQDAAEAEGQPEGIQAEEGGSLFDKLVIHGYLSQAYAATDGNAIVGIPHEGTADYRTAALQFRAAVTEQDTFAIQLSHERLGVSGTQALQEDVALDWIYYEHRFGDTSVKVGRALIPFGIYNQVRDVGTLLPFYRPSTDFYGEGPFTSETVDGILLSHSLTLGDGWRLSGDVYYGGWDYIARDVARDPVFLKASADDALGFELWLDTPLPGLRLGAGRLSWDQDGQRSWTYHASTAAKFGRVAAKVEYKHNVFNVGIYHGSYDGAYAHLGVALTDKLTVNGQIEHFDIKSADFNVDTTYDDDKALGVNYAFRPDLVLKLEHHWNEGYTPESPPQNYFAPAPKTRSWIASLSVSF